MSWVRLRDGERLFVRVLGRGQPVLVLSGLGMHSLHWLPFIAPFLHRYRFYIPDYRGFGRSKQTRLPQASVFDSHCNDLEDVVAHFGLDQLLLVGYSLGASTALHWAQRSGFARVRRYLHIDQSPCIATQPDWVHGLLGARQPEFFALLQRLQQVLASVQHDTPWWRLPLSLRQQVSHMLAELAHLMTGQSGFGALLQRSVWLPKLWARCLPFASIGHAQAYLHSYLHHTQDHRTVLVGAATPVTMLIGLRSALYPAQGQLQVAAAWQAKVVAFADSGHAPLLDQPLAFVRALGGFLQASGDPPYPA